MILFHLFRILKKEAPTDWVSDTFTKQELASLERAFQPLGDMPVEGLLRSSDPFQVGSLAGYLKTENLRHLGYKVFQRADGLISEHAPVLSLHFYWQGRGEFFYRWRNHDEFALEEAVKSFQRQIGLAQNALEVFRSSSWGFIPAHRGYSQLRIIEEKRGNFELARTLCERAKEEGWDDDWDKHITRIDKKLAKLTVQGANGAATVTTRQR